MVLLGGVQNAGGAGGGRGGLHLAARHGGAQHRLLARMMGATMLLLVLLFPQGIAGYAQRCGRG